MPKLSTRSYEMPASPIRKLVPLADEAKKRGIKVYHLNIGQPDIKTPEVALEPLKNFSPDTIIEYTNSAGLESYRRALAGYYQGVGIDVDYTDILITAGGSEALFFTFMTLFNQGEEVIIPEPFYTNYNSIAREADVKIVPITSTIENGFALPSIEEFEKRITDKTKAILICNPSNPTGALYSREELEQLREIALKHDLFLIADEVYREFVYDGYEHFSVMQLKGIEDRVVLIDSNSKRFSQCGTRTGYLVSKNKEFIKLALKYGMARLSPPYFGQIVGEASLRAPKEYFQQVYDEYVKRRNFLIDALNKIPGVFAPMPHGAFYTIARLPIDDSEKFCSWLLSDFNDNGETIMFAPAPGFYATPGLGKDEVRIAYVLNVDDLKRSMEILEKALEQYPGTKR